MKEVTKKIHFIAYDPSKPVVVPKEPVPTVIVSTKYNTITFGKHILRETSMVGQLVRFFYDPDKRILGWQLADKNYVDQTMLGQYKLCTPHPTTGVWVVSITSILKMIRGLKEKHSYTGLPVNKYREKSVASAYKDTVFYFVEITENPTGETETT